MSSKEFDCITFYDLDLKIEGFLNNERRQSEEGRFKAYTAYIAPHLDPKKLKGLTPQKFMPFEWDSSEAIISFEDKKEAFRNLLKNVNAAGQN